MGKFKQIEYTGKKYGRLTVLGIHHHSKTRHTYVTCQCECGARKVIRASSLVQGITRSCGCLDKEEKIRRKTKHGMFGTRIYDIWAHIKSRCDNKNTQQYKNYGGRGIKYCTEWKDFEKFYEWAKNNGYAENLTIDRINVNGNYEPENCRWILEKYQHRNTRTNKMLEYKGERHCASEWAEKLDLNYNTLLTHLRGGWGVKEALEYKNKKGLDKKEIILYTKGVRSKNKPKE